MMKPVAIITGSSRGIGAEIARLFAEKGFAVCINYYQAKDRAQTLVDEQKQQHCEAIAVQADMKVEDAIIGLFNTVDQQLGQVSVLVNNAAINGAIGQVESLEQETLQAVFATNVFGSFIAAREAIKRMKQHGSGNIINISSETARFGGTNLAHYAASKAAINTFTVALAREVAADQIRVNAISPGVIDTEIHHASPPERRQRLLDSIPMQRMGSAREVAELAYWLTTQQASFVSGAIIPVTGAR